ncbi:unnamed protein product [Hyaloperonospora brassicae]|uniref:Protein kinase domain-containing protein n=1 Tax=Hyaloperonospora brassicae TaxID=162125 RepID=A0AAV0UQM8_HYABA|nr:unnamed protein product [Hyaloperonospora brassicae]
MRTTGELHSHLMMIQTYLRCTEDVDAQSVRPIRVQFDATAASFTAYLTKYHTKHLASRLVHLRAICKEKRRIADAIERIHALIHAPSATALGTFRTKSIARRACSPGTPTSRLTKHDTTYTYDSTSDTSSFHDDEIGNDDRLSNDDDDHLSHDDTVGPVSHNCLTSLEVEKKDRVACAVWADPWDATLRDVWIPREQVVLDAFVTRGAYGEVYRGTYKGQTVAVKTMSDMDRSLQEIQMAVQLRHPNIVHCIGVAWNYQRDMCCCVMEFMAGGDLRTLLDHYSHDSVQYALGFDFQKLLIAYQVVRALVYMHSRAATVIHRDLKSKNILLTRDLDAKVTDFGLSRRCAVVGPMTANVGTSLWMAPEVMLGKPYNETADMFSFGVVLSELSLHALPYAAHSQVEAGGNSHLVILRRVATGDLCVDFAEAGPPAVVQLGRACVSMDVTERPTAVEAMRVLHAALVEDARMEVMKTCSG